MKLLDSQKIDIGHLTVVIGRYETNDTPSVIWETIERGDAVAALVFNRQTRRLSFLQQSRPATLGKTYFPDDFLEVMAGVIEPDETAYEALERELVEEVGYAILRHEFIGRFFVSPGGTTERIFLYYVEVDGKVDDGGGIGDEEISEYAIPVSHVKSYLDSGSIEDAKTIIGIQWFLINKLNSFR